MTVNMIATITNLGIQQISISSRSVVESVTPIKCDKTESSSQDRNTETITKYNNPVTVVQSSAQCAQYAPFTNAHLERKQHVDLPSYLTT